jgi:hypothetical protein
VRAFVSTTQLPLTVPRSPYANGTARQALMTGLWTSLISDSLTEYAYDAELAGLHYNVSSDKRALFVVCGGYNDKLHVLARRVLERIRHVDITPEQLAVVKEQYKPSRATSRSTFLPTASGRTWRHSRSSTVRVCAVDTTCSMLMSTGRRDAGRHPAARPAIPFGDIL